MVRKCNDFIEYACGRPFPGVEVKLVSHNGDTVPPYIRGDLCIRSAGMFKCYYNDDESTKAALSDDGWYKSGDVGYMIDKGIIYAEGRLTRSILVAFPFRRLSWRCSYTTMKASKLPCWYQYLMIHSVTQSAYALFQNQAVHKRKWSASVFGKRFCGGSSPVCSFTKVFCEI